MNRSVWKRNDSIKPLQPAQCGLLRFRLHHTHCSELGVLLEPSLITPRKGGLRMKPMPDKPDTWVIALAWLSQHSPTIYAATLSFVMAALRIIYGGGTRRQAMLEATICMLLTTSLIAVLEYFGLPSTLATPAGIWIGFLGVKKIADLADRFADFKLPKRSD